MLGEENVEEVTSRFNENSGSFICAEALKIYVRAANDEVALKALELLEKAAQLL